MIARTCLTIGALAPYWKFLTLGVIFVTDDYFASDIFNGELAGRVLAASLLRRGEWPVWTNQLCSGIPLAGTPADPLGLALFSLGSPAVALDLFVIVLLLIAAHGAYGLARRLGADRFGAVLAGLAFAGSGYIACQLKHLGIISTVVWLPTGLLLLDRALAVDELPGIRRSLLLAGFGLVFAEQSLCGFPQSAYICGLVYVALVLVRIVAYQRSTRRWRTSTLLLGGAAAAAALGAAAGALVLLPLAEFGRISDRVDLDLWTWILRLKYWPPNVLTFVAPYINGDISNGTYAGPPLTFFWEDYGYVGVATFFLAFYGAVREWRRPAVVFTIAVTSVAYLFVLGPATPVFHAAFVTLPGMNAFRFPTRFLIVVELGIALLAAIGLSGFLVDLERAGIARLPARVVVAGICLATALDLFVHQPRQNPIVPGDRWLAAPATAAVITADTNAPRTFTPRHRDIHRSTFARNRGWTNVQPYFALRDLLEPNTGGGFWAVPSADCYAGIAPRWYVDVWGDHNREWSSLFTRATTFDFDQGKVGIDPVVPGLLKIFGVTHVLTRAPQDIPGLTLIGGSTSAFVYRVAGAARVRVVPAARFVASDVEASARLLDRRFDPDREVLIHDASDEPWVSENGVPRNDRVTGWAAITREDSRTVVVDAEAVSGGFLLLADTYYPGWSARVDGQPAPLLRADISLRAVPLTKGRHQVRFSYDPPGLARGARVTMAAVSSLLLWFAAALVMSSRGRTRGQDS